MTASPVVTIVDIVDLPLYSSRSRKEPYIAMSDLEKNKLELVETNTTESPSENALQKQETLQHVDLSNTQAFKGDDSDGKVEWTIRKLLAAAFLAMLYTGMSALPTVSVV